ncbi:MAG: holin [Corynebacterium sp.]|nr:holin [Corynebacterium sp.]
MWTKIFWLDTADRAIRTFAQALLATVTVGDAIYQVDWQAGLGIAATAAVASVLTSISTSKVGAGETAALVSTAPAKHAAE